MALPPNYLFVNPKDGRLVSRSYLQVPGGTSADPGISFIDSADSGFSCGASGVVSIISDGVQGVTVSSSAVNLISPVSLTGSLSFPLGTAAAPSLYPGTDTNTGIYSPGADQLAISTGGTGQLFIDSNGRVGIGTSTPSVELTISQGATGAGTNGRIALGDIGPGTPNARIDGYRAGGSFAGELHLYTSTALGAVTRAVTIDSTQRVGIGTTSPTVPLFVNGEIYAKASTGGDNDYGVSICSGPSLANTSAHKIRAGGGVGQLLLIETQTAGGNGQILLATNGSERARIDSSGRLLVGTSSSSGTGIAVFQGIPGNQFTSTDVLFQSGAGAVSSGNGIAVLSFGALSNRGAFIQTVAEGTWTAGSSHPTAFVFATTPSGSASQTERMRITSDAYVRLASGTGGIQFNGDTAAANALDDYEEGTWTPTVIGLTTAGTGTYSTQSGKYIKIGGKVYVEVSLEWSAHTGTGSMAFGGLPFTSPATGLGSGMSIGRVNNLAITAGCYLTAYQSANSALVILRAIPTGGGAENAVALDTAAAINFSLTYSVV